MADVTPRRYAWRLSDKGVKIALIFILFHHNLCGPSANSLVHDRPDPNHRPKIKIETPSTRRNASVREVIRLLEAV